MKLTSFRQDIKLLLGHCAAVEDLFERLFDKRAKKTVDFVFPTPADAVKAAAEVSAKGESTAKEFVTTVKATNERVSTLWAEHAEIVATTYDEYERQHQILAGLSPNASIFSEGLSDYSSFDWLSINHFPRFLCKVFVNEKTDRHNYENQNLFLQLLAHMVYGELIYDGIELNFSSWNGYEDCVKDNVEAYLEKVIKLFPQRGATTENAKEFNKAYDNLYIFLNTLLKMQMYDYDGETTKVITDVEYQVLESFYSEFDLILSEDEITMPANKERYLKAYHDTGIQIERAQNFLTTLPEKLRKQIGKAEQKLRSSSDRDLSKLGLNKCTEYLVNIAFMINEFQSSETNSNRRIYRINHMIAARTDFSEQNPAEAKTSGETRIRQKIR